MKKTWFSWVIIGLIACLIPLVGVQAAEMKVPTLKDILDLKTPNSLQISPDGTRVLYVVRETDWEENAYGAQIWLADIKTGDIRQLTFTKERSFEPAWSPDGRWISFLSARKESTQIYLMSTLGGEARCLTKAENGISSYRWSPDGKSIAFTAADKISEEQEAVEKEFGKFEIVDTEFNIRHLWIINIDEGDAKKLVARPDLHIGSLNWSPDTAYIAFSATPDSRIESGYESDIYTVSLQDGSLRHLVDLKGSDGSPCWSPEGDRIAFSSKRGARESFANTEICIIPAEGGKITSITQKFDENASPLVWTHKGIYFNASQGMSAHLLRADPPGKSVIRITKGDGFMRGFSLSKDGTKMVFTSLDGAHFVEIYASAVDVYAPRKVTDFSSQVADWKLGRKESIRWKSQDGAEITGVLMKPHDFDPNKKYPLLVVIHGGPTGISYPQWVDGRNSTYPLEQWLAKGAVILQPNYRGSAGFGADFRRLNFRNLGVGDYWDVISGVDHLIAQGFVDESRLGAMGWSQGGYISAYITTFSDRFKAVSVGAGISDWVTYYVNTDIHPFTRIYLGATPWDDADVYRKTSPMTHILNAKTPTLIQHGEFDRRVPIPNAFKLYQGLRDMGVPVKFIIYKGFGHGITKPKEKLAVLTHNWEWFNQYLWEETNKDSH